MNDTQTDNPAVLRCRDLRKTFTEGAQTLEVLKGIDLEVRRGERMAILGSSGAGKSTLLQLLGGLDTPTAGSVEIQGEDLSVLSDNERGRVRNESMGFVYQFHHLLPEFSALENVAMPLLIRRDSAGDALGRATEVLEQVGLGERLSHRPGELSGGERQRAAVARALVTHPAVVLADEPTGNLDHRTGDRVFDLMMSLNESVGSSLVVVTHDLRLAERMDRIVTLEDGLLTG